MFNLKTSPQQSYAFKEGISFAHPLTTSCWLSHWFEYTRESAGEERKEPLPNNVFESAFQRTNRAIHSKLTGLSPHVI